MVGEDILQSRPVADIGKVAPRPAFIIHARGDQLIPLSHAEQLVAAYPSAHYWVVESSEHAKTYNADPEIYVSRVTKFFSQSLKQ